MLFYYILYIYFKAILVILIYTLHYYRFLNYLKLNYSTNLRLSFILFYVKLIHVISSYILNYSRSFYFMLFDFKYNNLK